MRRIRKVIGNIREEIRKNLTEMLHDRPVKGNFRMPLGNIHQAKSNILLDKSKILLDTFQSQHMPAIYFFIHVILPTQGSLILANPVFRNSIQYLRQGMRQRFNCRLNYLA